MPDVSVFCFFFFFSSRRRHTRCSRDWSSDVCSSDLVFEPNSTAIAATTQMLVQGALQQHLSHLIAVEGVEVRNDDGALRVDVRYVVLRSEERRVGKECRARWSACHEKKKKEK